MVAFKRIVVVLGLVASLIFGFAVYGQGIIRTGEGRNFYNNIFIPSDAETL